jgi:hypothetical protein
VYKKFGATMKFDIEKLTPAARLIFELVVFLAICVCFLFGPLFLVSFLLGS